MANDTKKNAAKFEFDTVAVKELTKYIQGIFDGTSTKLKPEIAQQVTEAEKEVERAFNAASKKTGRDFKPEVQEAIKDIQKFFEALETHKSEGGDKVKPSNPAKLKKNAR